MPNPFKRKSKRRSIARPFHLAMLTLLITIAAPLTAVSSSPLATRHSSLATPDPPLSTSDLWIDLLIGPPLVPLFNSTARSGDIARVDHPSQISQLDGISRGQKMVVFKSVTEAEQLLPGLADQIDIVGYNLEHGPVTPSSLRSRLPSKSQLRSK